MLRSGYRAVQRAAPIDTRLQAIEQRIDHETITMRQPEPEVYVLAGAICSKSKPRHKNSLFMLATGTPPYYQCSRQDDALRDSAAHAPLAARPGKEKADPRRPAFRKKAHL